MSDDPGYFPAPIPGSNAIGLFVTGTSPIGPIGTASAFVWQNTVISQYANSDRLLRLISDFNDNVNPAVDINAFYDLMFNLDTSQGYGLDVWGRIVGVGRTLAVDAGDYFGFKEAADTTIVGWDQEPFYAGPPSTNNYALTDNAYRQLILAKAAANICDGSIPAINSLLMLLFPDRGNAYVQEGFGDDPTYFGFAEAGASGIEGWNNGVFYLGESFHPMTMRYVFDFALTPVELAIVEQSGVLPTPTGVLAIIIVNP